MSLPSPRFSAARCARRSVVAAALAALALLASPTSAGAQTFAERLVVRGELGAGTMISDYQRSALLYGLDVQGSVRLGFTLVGPLALQASYSTWWFPSESADNTRPAGQQHTVSGGLRLEPMLGSAGRLFVDVNVGAGFTGSRRRLAIDGGLGFELALGRAVGLGPVVRYGRLFAGDEAQDYPSDAQYWSGGLSLSVRLPRAVEAAPVDSDGDGVLDPDDLCPEVPAGATPDPRRPGCPAGDRDSDGVLDADDRCPDVPAGAHPDPARAGCPAADADGDGVYDPQDLCPTVPQGASPDPERPGCPDGDADGDGVLDHADRCPQEPQGPTADPARPGCPAPIVAVVVPPILFGTDRYQVTPPSFRALAAAAALLRERAGGWRLAIDGHTDNVGSEAHNSGLSDRRAQSVADWFTRHGVPATLLEVHGYGLERPIVSNDSDEGRSRNRRVELRLLDPRDAAAPARSQ